MCEREDMWGVQITERTFYPTHTCCRPFSAEDRLGLLAGPSPRPLTTQSSLGVTAPHSQRHLVGRSGQEVNEEDGQANVEQDHHADEDCVRNLGAEERMREVPPTPNPNRACTKPVYTSSTCRKSSLHRPGSSSRCPSPGRGQASPRVQHALPKAV